MRVLTLAALCALTFGCSCRDERPAAPTTTAEKPTVAADAAAPDPKAELEKALLGIAKCEVRSTGVDRRCESYRDFENLKKKQVAARREALADLKAVGLTHLGHESPAIRLAAASLLGSGTELDAAAEQALVAAAGKEIHPQVMKSLLRVLSPKAGKSPAVAELLANQLANADEGVRTTALTGLTSSYARGATPDPFPKIAAMLDAETAPKVKEQVCKRIGNLGDERALPILEARTADATKDPGLYGACLAGLVTLWSSPTAEQPSEKAYRLTLERLAAKPRNLQVPPWAALSGLAWATKPTFKAKAPWFEPKEVEAILTEIVTDKDTHWMTRTSAISILRRLETEKAVFEGLAKAYGDPAKVEGPDRNVLTSLEKAIKGERDSTAFDRPLSPGLKERMAQLKGGKDGPLRPLNGASPLQGKLPNGKIKPIKGVEMGRIGPATMSIDPTAKPATP